MNRKPPSASAAPSSPEERSSSSSPDRLTPSDSKKRQVVKKGKGSTRTVSNLTEDQLERKRANDREAQRNIRQRTKDNIKQLEVGLEGERTKVADRDARIRQLEEENAHLHGQLQLRFPHESEGRAMSLDPRRRSVVSEAGSWQQQQQQQQSRRQSHAESMEMRAPPMASPATMLSPGTEMTQARPQGFPDPPNQYRNPQAFARNQALGQPAGPSPASPTAYGHGQHGPTEQGTGFPSRLVTQHDPLRYPVRNPELMPQGMSEGPAPQLAEARGEADSQGPRAGQQYQYAQILRSSPHDQQFQHPEQPPEHYPQYQGHGGYALPPPGGGQQYAQPVPQYGPVESYPTSMSTSTAQHSGYTSAQGVPGRPPPYGYYPGDYAPHPT